MNLGKLHGACTILQTMIVSIAAGSLIPPIPVSAQVSTAGTPQGTIWAKNQTNQTIYSTVAPATSMNAAALSPSGGNQPHENMMPFLVITFIISLFGVFPTQN